MIKRLIFDLDNTLIIWKDEYISSLVKTMKNYHVNVDYNIINDIMEEQEKLYNVMDKSVLLNDINTKCNLNLDISFIDEILDDQKKLANNNDYELINTIKYLSSKYELVVLTNWFTETQRGRLETAGILKYFKEVYGGDLTKLKPNKESFIMAKGNHNFSECIMIGDDDYRDIKGALDVGMKVIKYDYKNLDNEKRLYPVINKISELKEML